ncbi:MAG: DUF2207 domain-containing protein [Bacteroidetes bacterium]|nr:MAG: DUF2207 domain-containing protein [Bacteroidota bacterium]
MKRHNPLFVQLISAILLTGFFSFQSHARSFTMSALDVNIQLQEDGTMLVEEHREFTFQGRFSEVFRTFPLHGQATFSNFRVLENGQPYPLSDSKSPGTFMIDEKTNDIEVRIFMNSVDTIRTFTVQFEARGAVQRYEDAVLLYYQIISDEWTQAIFDIDVRIVPPGNLSAGEPAHWVHGSLEAVSAIRENGVVEIELEHLPRHRFLEIRALYPPEAFALMPVLPGNIREEVMLEASQLAEEANQRRLEAIEKEKRRVERFKLGRQIALPLALLVLFFWVWLFRKYHTKPVISNKEEVFSKLPEKDLPALVSYLFFQTSVVSNALVSTLFHLAYRGFVTIKEEEKSDITFYLNRKEFETRKDELKEYEQKLLTYLFEDLTPVQDKISLKYIKSKSTRMQTFFPKWKKLVVEEAKKKEWYNEESKKGRNTGLIVSFILFFIFFASVILFGPWMLIPMAMTFAFLIGSFFIYHRTEKGEIAYRQWKNLRKQLKKKKFSPTTEKLDQASINEYLIYGTALALGTGFNKRLFNHVEQTGNQSYIYWILLHQANMNSFGKTINKIITTTGTTMSSSTGAGGGGTMGGGGGAASGGGGAR